MVATMAAMAARACMQPSARRLNNRAESSHQPTCQRERRRKRFKDSGQVQPFLTIHDPITNLFHLRRDHSSVTDYRKARARAFQILAEVAGAPLAA
jgi:putative transposase